MDKLEDLSSEPWASQALEGVLSGVTVDGGVYGLPYNIEGYGLAYNKAIFEDAGIDASTIKDYASLDAALATLQTKIDNGDLKRKISIIRSTIEYAASETWVTGLHSSNIALANEFESSLEAFDAETLEFKHADAFKAYLDLNAKYSANAKSTAK